MIRVLSFSQVKAPVSSFSFSAKPPAPSVVVFDRNRRRRFHVVCLLFIVYTLHEVSPSSYSLDIDIRGAAYVGALPDLPRNSVVYRPRRLALPNEYYTTHD